MHLGAELRAGTQPRIGADQRAGADGHALLVALDVGEGMDHRAGLDARVGDDAVRADAHALAQLDAALEEAVDVDLHVLRAGEFAAQVEARRVGQAHAGLHQPMGLAALPGALQRRQLHGAVDAGHLQFVRRLLRDDRHAFVHRHLHHVGQVVLALGVVVGEPAEPALERRGGRGHHAGVRLAHGALGLGGVLLLDDALHAAVIAAQHAAVAGGVGQRDGQERQAPAAAGRHQRAQRVGGDERHVAREDERDAVVRQVRRGLLHRMARAELRRLAHEGERRLRRDLPQAGLHLVGAVARHHHQRARAEADCRVRHVADQRPAGEAVQHLRQAALHARAHAGGHDDDIDGRGGLRRCAHGADSIKTYYQR